MTRPTTANRRNGRLHQYYPPHFTPDATIAYPYDDMTWPPMPHLAGAGAAACSRPLRGGDSRAFSGPGMRIVEPVDWLLEDLTDLLLVAAHEQRVLAIQV